MRGATKGTADREVHPVVGVGIGDECVRKRLDLLIRSSQSRFENDHRKALAAEIDSKRATNETATDNADVAFR
jgi:hypothetical protein